MDGFIDGWMDEWMEVCELKHCLVFVLLHCLVASKFVQ